jgi:cytosine/creatinine deaminase
MDKYMQLAIQEAQATKDEGGSPYGAVLIRGDEIIGMGRNRMIQNNDPISHGEIEAIRNAGLQDTFADTILYTTAFPCIMCAGAIVRQGIPKVIIGASWEHNKTSREFMQSHGIELDEWKLDECYQLVD